jgi:hypothetical protein
MNQYVHRAASVGITAWEILSKDQQAQIAGKTSKGLFVQTADRWLVFISIEPNRGPLTINLKQFEEMLTLIPVGSAVRIASHGLHLPGLHFSINLKGSQIWQPAPACAAQPGEPGCGEALVQAVEEIQLLTRETGLADFLPSLAGIADAPPAHQCIHGFDWEILQRLQNCLRMQDASALVEQLSSRMGTGPGLTPSADDFIVGLLLTLNRWKIPPWTAGHLHALNARLVKAAYEKTTTLSANLIECAGRGLANERLINALDWIVSGRSGAANIVADLLGWGNSSGLDAFTGMAAAIRASSPEC